MAENNLERLLQQGISAAKQGNNATARRLLESVIAHDDTNELAWIWLASTVTTVRERRFCLEKVLQINPSNNRARDALNALVGVGAEATRNANDLTRAAANATAARGGGGAAGGLDLSSPYVRIGAVVVLVIIAAVALPPLFQRPPQETPPPTFNAFAATATPNYTSTPIPTPTFNGVFVTRAPRELPPSFTPTFTPTPTDTPVPTATPYPFDAFTMLVSETGEDGKTGIYQYAGDGTGQTGLATDARDAGYSRDGQQIVFIRDVAYPAEGDQPAITVGEVFMGSVRDVANAQQITSLKTHSARHPRFSPDGRQVVFTSDYDGDDELWLIDPNTKITNQLTFNTVSDRDAEFSPDGTKLIFISDRESPGLPDLYLLTFVQNPEAQDPNSVNDSGHAVIRLVDLVGGSYSPTWSPDGTRIAFINDQEGDGDVYMATADGTRIITLNVAADAEDKAPSWTPDGRRVAFVSNREEDRFQVYAVDVTTRDVTRLFNTARDVQDVTFQPNAAFRLP